MNPEDRALIERTLKLSEENNVLLKKMRSAQRRATIYGFLRLALVIVPLVLGYLFLEPYIDGAVNNYQSFEQLLSR